MHQDSFLQDLEEELRGRAALRPVSEAMEKAKPSWEIQSLGQDGTGQFRARRFLFFFFFSDHRFALTGWGVNEAMSVRFKQ